jgi:hypothetical protein
MIGHGLDPLCEGVSGDSYLRAMSFLLAPVALVTPAREA